jgi:branched-chain amino acid transport system substrate-binding protein
MTEDKVDIIIGPTVTPTSLAIIDAVAEGQTPTIALGAAANVTDPVDSKRYWVFKTPQKDALMAGAIAEHMAKNGIKTVGLIGYSTSYGDSWTQEFDKLSTKHNIKVVGNERYAPTDTSVTGQVLKITAANPDAVLILASGTPAALPQHALKERGYKGKIYQTHGAGNPDFLRVCAKDCEGTYLPLGPVMIADQLPEKSQVKKTGLAYKNSYESTFKTDVTAFGGYVWDAMLLLSNAAPEALKKAKPGTPEFRKALRDNIETTKNLVTTQSVINMSPTDHNGLDERARVMAQIVGGKWKYEND